jgi:hypothetical protein
MITAGLHGDAIAGSGKVNQEGGSNVVDDCCNTHNSMAVGIAEWLYDG